MKAVLLENVCESLFILYNFKHHDISHQATKKMFLKSKVNIPNTKKVKINARTSFDIKILCIRDLFAFYDIKCAKTTMLMGLTIE